MSIMACDVDLHRIHAYSSETGRVCYNSSEWPWEAMRQHDTVLIEVASPVMTGKLKAEEFNRRKWAIGNSLQVGRLLYWAQLEGHTNKLLVSPSNLWTLGYKEEIREVMAGCAGQDNHDIRACRCMLFFHERKPTKWVPLLEYYHSLSNKKKKGTKI